MPENEGAGREEGGWRAGTTTRPRDLFTTEAKAMRPRLPCLSALGLVREEEGRQGHGPSGLSDPLAGGRQSRGCRE